MSSLTKEKLHLRSEIDELFKSLEGIIQRWRQAAEIFQKISHFNEYLYLALEFEGMERYERYFSKVKETIQQEITPLEPICGTGDSVDEEWAIAWNYGATYAMSRLKFDIHWNDKSQCFDSMDIQEARQRIIQEEWIKVAVQAWAKCLFYTISQVLTAIKGYVVTKIREIVKSRAVARGEEALDAQNEAIPAAFTLIGAWAKLKARCQEAITIENVQRAVQVIRNVSEIIVYAVTLCVDTLDLLDALRAWIWQKDV